MVPMFKKLYLGLGDELFWLTRVLLNISDSLRIHTESWILGALICGTLLVAIYRTLGFSWLLNLIPSRKRLRESVRMLFYCRGMEFMLSKGVLLLEDLPLAEEMLLGLLHKRIAHLRKAVDAGKSLREAYSMVPIFSPMFVKNIALGESSGHLSSSFARIGRQNQESIKKMAWATR